MTGVLPRLTDSPLNSLWLIFWCNHVGSSLHSGFGEQNKGNDANFSEFCKMHQNVGLLKICLQASSNRMRCSELLCSDLPGEVSGAQWDFQASQARSQSYRSDWVWAWPVSAFRKDCGLFWSIWQGEGPQSTWEGLTVLMMFQTARREGPKSLAHGIRQRPGLQECACGPALDLTGAIGGVAVYSPLA